MPGKRTAEAALLSKRDDGSAAKKLHSEEPVALDEKPAIEKLAEVKATNRDLTTLLKSVKRREKELAADNKYLEKELRYAEDRADELEKKCKAAESCAGELKAKNNVFIITQAVSNALAIVQIQQAEKVNEENKALARRVTELAQHLAIAQAQSEAAAAEIVRLKAMIPLSGAEFGRMLAASPASEANASSDSVNEEGDAAMRTPESNGALLANSLFSREGQPAPTLSPAAAAAASAADSAEQSARMDLG